MLDDGLPAIDRGLLRRLDWARPSNRPPDLALTPAPTPTSAPSTRFDISAILDAVQATATSMTAMAERIAELKAHLEAFAASNRELEADQHRLTKELGDAVQQRDALAEKLAAENERLRQLEVETAQHVTRASALEWDLDATRADLTEIVGAVDDHLGLEARQ